MTDSGTHCDSVYEAGDPVEDAENLDPVAEFTGDDPDEIMQTGYSPPEREPHNVRDAPTPDQDAHPDREVDEVATDVGTAVTRPARRRPPSTSTSNASVEGYAAAVDG